MNIITQFVFSTVLLVGSMAQAVQTSHDILDLKKSENSIFVTHSGPSKGSVLVVHGLNLKPSKMNALVESVYSSGFDVYRLTLSGHDGDMEALKNATAEKWMGEVVSAEKEMRSHLAKSRSENRVLLLGYSLGAVAGLAASHDGLVQFDRLVLIAPPIAMTKTAKLVKNLFGFPGMMLPSKNHVDYRVHPKTPVAAYKALFDLMEWVKTGPAASLASSQALVFLCPEDELVDSVQTTDFVAQKLNAWEVRSLSKENASLKPVSHHLMIDEPSLGANPFRELLETANAFIAAQ